MKGVLRAISIQTYGIYGKGKRPMFQFVVPSSKKRRKIDGLQGTEVDYDKDIEPLVK